MKTFVGTYFNKIQRFLLNQDEIGTNCAVDKYTKISAKIRISANIEKVKYQPNSVGPMYLSVSSFNKA